MVLLLRHLYQIRQEMSFVAYWRSSWWVIHDWLVVALFWTILGLRYYVRDLMAGLGAQAPFDPDTHYPLFNAAMSALTENNVLAIEALLVYFKVFKYVGHVPYIRRFGASMAKARKDMAAFLVVFAITMLSFATAFHLAFGTDVHELRDMGASFMTLMRFIVGDINVQPLLSLNMPLAIILVLGFTFLVYLQLVNMAVAILVRSYSSQPSDKEAAEELVHTLASRSANLYTRSKKLSREMAHRANTMASKLGNSLVPQDVAGSNISCAMRRASRENRSLINPEVLSALQSEFRPRTAQPESGETKKHDIKQRERDLNPRDLNPLVDDPISAALLAFQTEAARSDQSAVVDTQKATEHLKMLFLKLTNEQAHANEMIEVMRTAVLTLRDENFAISHALTAKGIRFDPQDPLRTLPPDAAKQAATDTIKTQMASIAAPVTEASAGRACNKTRPGPTSDVMAISGNLSENMRPRNQRGMRPRKGVL